MDRALAHVELVRSVRPIEGADNIELITVLGWQCIARKGEFKVGDKAVYIEIDSQVPEDDVRFAFLAQKKFKVKTMKLNKFEGGIISQGLALPISSFPELNNATVGQDVTKELRIIYSNPNDRNRKRKYSREDFLKSLAATNRLLRIPLIKSICLITPVYKIIRRIYRKKITWEPFPNWIAKTDETRIENIPDILTRDTGDWIATEKVDGTSCTFYLQKKKGKYEFGVCSRNRRLLETDKNNSYWAMAEKYDICNRLKTFAIKRNLDRVVLQGECAGPEIQGNPYKLSEKHLYVFNLLIDFPSGELIRLGSVEMTHFCEAYGFEHVPILDYKYKLERTMEEMKAAATGFSQLNQDVMREGIVYRSHDGKQSFKNVSNDYLLKKKRGHN